MFIVFCINWIFNSYLYKFMSKKKRSGFPQIIYHSKEEIEFSQKTTFVTKEVDGDSVISCPEAGKMGLF